jgi:hypothetical protein
LGIPAMDTGRSLTGLTRRSITSLSATLSPALAKSGNAISASVLSLCCFVSNFCNVLDGGPIFAIEQPSYIPIEANGGTEFPPREIQAESAYKLRCKAQGLNCFG